MDGPLLEGAGGGSAAAIILALYMAWAALEAGLEVLLPLWMLSPGERSQLCARMFFVLPDSFCAISRSMPVMFSWGVLV